jgi:hypothetical protein
MAVVRDYLWIINSTINGLHSPIKRLTQNDKIQKEVYIMINSQFREKK